MNNTCNLFEEENGFKEILNCIKKDIIIEEKTVLIDLNQILAIDYKIYEQIINNPEISIKLLEEAINSIFLKNKKIIFLNLNIFQEINKLRTEDLGKLICIKGNIKRLTKIIPRTKKIHFECPSCGANLIIEQDKKKTKQPLGCSCGRRGGFRVTKEEFTDIQELNLEEIHDEIDGKQPQQIRIYLEDFLTDNTMSERLQAGKKIEVIGILSRLPAFMTKTDEKLNLSEFMVYANNIIASKLDSDIIISEEDKKQIIEIAKNNPLEKMSESLAPEVYGNEIIKKAIILQMVRGVPRLRSDETLSREDLHILICGDIGTGKSILIKSASIKTPHSKMVIGTRTSRAGLGAMCIKDELTNTWSLEISSLVLANKSTLFIDEIDKMNKENLSELLEPMSVGTVSLNKAGISACLQARTSILAVANPIFGNYDITKPLPKQIDLPPPILNRFDLVFVMIDIPEREFDKNSIEHIFNSYEKPRETLISLDLFRKYILYCKKLKPILKKDLLEDIQNFYITIRQKSNADGEKGLPINLRNIEGIIKLAEANAKLRLSEFVEKEDLKVAKEIFMFCLNQLAKDPDTGIYDISRLTEKIPSGKHGKIETLFLIIEKLAQNFNNLIPFEEIRKVTELQNYTRSELYDYLERLKREARIYEPKSNNYSML